MTVLQLRSLLLVSAALLMSGCLSNAERLFRNEVVPALERSCAAGTCHGVSLGAEQSGEVIDWSQLFFRLDEQGKLADLEAAYQTSLRTINTVDEPGFSSILRKPLSVGWGGVPHHGGDNFPTPDHESYQAISRWIALETEGGEDPAPLDDLEQLFADSVQPLLVGLSCANGNCHGPGAAIPYRLDTGIDGVISIAGTHKNYKASRGMLSLDGDPNQSRLLRKSLPLFAGGINHKGGNNTFLPALDDSRSEAIRTWACAERLAVTGASCNDDEASPIAGFVFLRGLVEAGDPFDLDVFTPGTDIWYAEVEDSSLTPSTESNLTAGLHGEPVDIRDLAVDPTGKRLLFAMRRDLLEGHEIYELSLEDGDVRQLTFDSGPLASGGLATNRDPTWGPDGHIWFVSTRAGVVADQGRYLDADLYELNPETGTAHRRSWTPHIERKPSFFTVGKVAGEISFTTLRDAVPEQAAAHIFRFSPDLHVEYHIHFGVTAAESLLFDLRELPDGRYVTTLGELDGAWSGGRLGVVDRNFGPEMTTEEGLENPSLPFFAPPLVRLDPDAHASGITATLYRDAAPLPDGRILATIAEGPLDLDDPDANPDLAIAILELAEDLHGAGPQVISRRVLVDSAGVADHDPEPVSVRYGGPVYSAPIDGGEGHTAPDGTNLMGRALLVYNGLPMVDAILGNLQPAGTKEIDERIVGVRLVETIPTSLGDRAPIAPEDSRHGVTGATNVSLSPHGPTRILGELPLAEDGTFQADLPAGTAVRLQGIDTRGMAVGNMHNRWFDFAGGQTMKQGITHGNELFYSAQCSVCHGARDGDPASVFIAPDVMTTATVTLSRFENRDPRRPLAAPVLSDQTRQHVDFLRDVQPILSESCLGSGCHSGSEPAGGLSLTDSPTTWFNDAYESLLRPGEESSGQVRLVDAGTGSARRSYLIEVLLGEELEADESLPTGAEFHPAGAPLTPEDLSVITRWIDLGATFSGGLEEGR